jgi:hypothetical protein
MWKELGKVGCWIELDCVALCLKLDSSRKNWDDFSIPGCKYWNTDHYLV